MRTESRRARYPRVLRTPRIATTSMLDSDTKRRINTARDILVGKVPDPKSQVEQITLALIYKFMDDIDQESVDLGGKRTFFTGKFKKFGWQQLMRTGLGGQEKLERYAEAIETMRENQNVPPLFQNIFKNAFLPYRDPETLRLFLEIIDEFDYSHSENLGNAFEYLLSVLGSQGDAGQFRTPRHIIDFIVQVVDPKKNETILDPACGTAGFLIAAYKHIIAANSDEKRKCTLSPRQRKKLMENIRGYDISPDMVRIALANMYLHGFPDPNIEEYDTLTSEDKWNEYADVILANPPFMSPKGGIRPHKRFGVKSKRSEVLFVDYMASHLTPKGRAGIIVPEGIIFQSQNAYKELRRMRVENSLVAVISLPAGVFQPYSGVKTSILILDKELAKKSNAIGFFKVENDGFDLGAQRRPIEVDDLPAIRQELRQYFEAIRGGNVPPPSSTQTTSDNFVHGLIVEKQKIAENGDYNLSGERYRETLASVSDFPTVALGDVCELVAGNTPSKRNKSYWRDGSVKWISSKHIDERGAIFDHEMISQAAVDDGKTKVVPSGATIIITRVSVGKFAFPDQDVAINQDLTALVPEDTRLDPSYLRVLAPDIARVVERVAIGIGVRGIKRKDLAAIRIPVPPLDVQKAIVAEIESYQKVIDGCRQVIDNYKPHIPINPDWPMVPLGEACTLSGGGTPSKKKERYWNGDIPWVSGKDMKGSTVSDAELRITQTAVEESSTKVAPVGSILVLVRGMGLANGIPFVEVTGPVAFNQDLRAIHPTDELSSRFLASTLRSTVNRNGSADRLLNKAAHGTLKLDTAILKSLPIPLPPLAEQEAIVAEIEAEQALVDANRELIERMEAKIEAAIARIWGQPDDAMPFNLPDQTRPKSYESPSKNQSSAVA